MKSTKKKIAISSPPQSKQPRCEQTREVSSYPVWAFQCFDIGGPWCLSQFSSVEEMIKVLQRMGNFERMTWVELRATGSHPVPIADIHKDAQNRLVEIKQDDIEELYSFRFSGPERL